MPLEKIDMIKNVRTPEEIKKSSSRNSLHPLETGIILFPSPSFPTPTPFPSPFPLTSSL